jgi:hypothetical protein
MTIYNSWKKILLLFVSAKRCVHISMFSSLSYHSNNQIVSVIENHTINDLDLLYLLWISNQMAGTATNSCVSRAKRIHEDLIKCTIHRKKGTIPKPFLQRILNLAKGFVACRKLSLVRYATFFLECSRWRRNSTRDNRHGKIRFCLNEKIVFFLV